MTIKVYIWYPSKVLVQKNSALSAFLLRDVGHVSMEVKDTYISHRPSSVQNNDSINFLEYFAQFIFSELSLEKYSENRNKSLNDDKKNDVKDKTKKYINFQPVKRADSTNYVEECKNKGRDADKIILIEGLNEEKILECNREQENSMYHPFNNNCCTFIASLIRNSLDCTFDLCDFCSLRYQHYPISLYDEDLKTVKQKVQDFLSLLRDRKLRSLVFSSITFVHIIPPRMLLLNRKLRGLVFSSIILSPIISPRILITVLPLIYTVYNFNIPVWTPKLMEEFLTTVNDNSEKLCLKTFS